MTHQATGSGGSESSSRRKPIKVLFVVPDLHVGGAERHVATLLPRMDQSRFRPSVVCIGEEGVFFDELLRAGIDAKALHLGGNRNIVRALFRLISIIRDEKPDVVILRGFNAETLGRLSSRIAGVAKTVVWVHFIGEVEPRNWMYAKLDRMLIPWTSAYFGVAEAQRPYLVREFGYPADRIQIIHNGVDPALYTDCDDRTVLSELGLSSSGKLVAIVAALRPEKDHFNLLRAARLVVDRLPESQFLIVGDGVMRGELENFSSEMGLSHNVHFLGMRTDVARILHAVDVFTLSSKTVECFPVALLEAMACSRPAVCTQVGGVSEMIEDGKTGYLVPPQNPQLLANRLVELLSDPSLAREMGASARRRLEDNFTLERSVRGAERAILELVGEDV